MLTYVGKNDEGEKIYIGTDKDWQEAEADVEQKLPEDPEPNDNGA